MDLQSLCPPLQALKDGKRLLKEGSAGPAMVRFEKALMLAKVGVGIGTSEAPCAASLQLKRSEAQMRATPEQAAPLTHSRCSAQATGDKVKERRATRGLAACARMQGQLRQVRAAGAGCSAVFCPL